MSGSSELVAIIFSVLLSILIVLTTYFYISNYIHSSANTSAETVKSTTKTQSEAIELTVLMGECKGNLFGYFYPNYITLQKAKPYNVTIKIIPDNSSSIVITPSTPFCVYKDKFGDQEVVKIAYYKNGWKTINITKENSYVELYLKIKE